MSFSRQDRDRLLQAIAEEVAKQPKPKKPVARVDQASLAATLDYMLHGDSESEGE